MRRISCLVSSATLGLRLGLGAVLVTSLAGCGGGGDEPLPLHNRLWLSKLPTRPSDTVGALVVLAAAEGRAQYGALYRGSLLRGGFELFEWKPEGDGRGRIRLLQDDRLVKIRTEPCRPDVGFHGCVLLHGDPSGVVRYQTRRRWGIKAQGGLPALDVAAELRGLAEVDPELALALPDET